MRGGLTAFLLVAALAPVPAAPAPEPVVASVEVATRAPNNPRAKFWYRLPRGHDPARRERWRVLVLFGGRNCDGRPEVSGKLGWAAWADLNGVVLVAPTFRDDAYWEPRAGAPALVTCGVGDVDRLRIGRTFACRYREAGGALVWRTMEGGHELGASALGLARAFFGAVASGAPCACWGEDGTWRILERERIDPEYRSPLYTPALAELWRRPR